MSLFTTLGQLRIELQYILGSTDFEIVVPSTRHVDAINFTLRRELGASRTTSEELYIRNHPSLEKGIQVLGITIRSRKK